MKAIITISLSLLLIIASSVVLPVHAFENKGEKVETKKVENQNEIIPQEKARVTYKRPLFSEVGLEGSFGVRSFLVESNVPQIDQMANFKTGGSLGIYLAGNRFTVPLSIGLYYAGTDSRTIDLFQAETQVNTSLVSEAFKNKTKLDLYSILGFSHHVFTFRGRYIPDSDTFMARRTGLMDEPLIGRNRLSQITGGVGFSYTVASHSQSIKLFAEMKRNLINQQSATVSVLDQTQIVNMTSVNMGVRIQL